MITFTMLWRGQQYFQWWNILNKHLSTASYTLVSQLGQVKYYRLETGNGLAKSNWYSKVLGLGNTINLTDNL